MSLRTARRRFSRRNLNPELRGWLQIFTATNNSMARLLRRRGLYGLLNRVEDITRAYNELVEWRLLMFPGAIFAAAWTIPRHQFGGDSDLEINPLSLIFEGNAPLPVEGAESDDERQCEVCHRYHSGSCNGD